MPDDRASYAFERSGRRPAIWFAMVVATFLLGLAWCYSAPWYIWAIWVPVAAALLFLLLANPKSGMELSDTHFTHWSGSARGTIAIAAIDHVSIESWSDSTEVFVWKRDGTKELLFSGSMPATPELQRALEQRGIRVERS